MPNSFQKGHAAHRRVQHVAQRQQDQRHIDHADRRENRPPHSGLFTFTTNRFSKGL